ncbi:phenylalanine--tRNA ligase subunit alpha [Myxococcota bacterium]|jgi:phenylalanyl-tRNA synthetase alpha chain|nr:phenylalanine--tRNA ligase subunit alpha [Myxococcota bacterium]
MDALREEGLAEVAGAGTSEALREVEVRWLGKKGRVTQALKELGGLAPEERRARGQALNELKRDLEAAIEERRREILREEIEAKARAEGIDRTLPGIPPAAGHLHPLTRVVEEVEDLFEGMGFHILDYPEAESAFLNFDGLNIPPDHPARETQDTFYLPGGNVLRTHTSPGQVRAMRELAPPFRAIFPGRVYRCEATDASHEHTFHQVEGLMVDRDVSVAHMLYSMMTLLEGIFGEKVQVRLRPGFFPFVEPGFELDLRCRVCGGEGCPVCKRSGWVELLPCGLVHPNVIRAGGLDPAEWEGWAFGLGLSRLVMMRYGIDDIRWLMSGDLRFVRQF